MNIHFRCISLLKNNENVIIIIKSNSFKDELSFNKAIVLL